MKHYITKKRTGMPPHACGVRGDSLPGRDGQAMVEFVIGLVGILVVTAGILLLAELHRADTETLATASAEAISDAMSGSIPSAFTPVQDWDEGPDGMRHTKDDEAVNGNFGGIRANVSSYTAPNGDWSGTRRDDGSSVKYDDIVRFNDGTLTSSAFNFMRAHEEATVETLPVLQSFMGLPGTITIENEVWMPAVSGLY